MREVRVSYDPEAGRLGADEFGRALVDVMESATAEGKFGFATVYFEGKDGEEPRYAMVCGPDDLVDRIIEMVKKEGR